MNKQAIQEKMDQPKNPHNEKVVSKRTTERFTDEDRKRKESKKRSLGGF